MSGVQGRGKQVDGRRKRIGFSITLAENPQFCSICSVWLQNSAPPAHSLALAALKGAMPALGSVLCCGN